MTIEGGDDWTPSLQESLEATEAVHDLFDQIGLGRAMANALAGAARRPAKLAEAAAKFVVEVGAVGARGVEQGLARREGALPEALAGDRRFSDPVWRENAWFTAVAGMHSSMRNLLDSIVEMGGLDGKELAKARFGARLALDAAAPTNFLPTNPVALRRAFETGGLSLARGLKNFVDDLRHNQGWPRQVDSSPFQLGVNMAATPGQVVFRNRLIELIRYEPQTERVREVPLLLCPPWINKYYIVDLAPGKSLVEFAVQQGFQCFVISYRNPDESMSDVGFDDYLELGPLAAVDAVCEITGARHVNTLAVCLGGTLNTCLLAYHDAIDERRVHSSAYLNCLNDFSGAGTLGDVFADEATVDRLTRRMESTGYLDAKDMAHTFDLLRANDLVFNYVVSNWLLGESPPAFDLLAWNNDSTNMPAAMHSTYLKRCYIDNALARDEMELLGERLMVSGITQDTYVVAAVDDHIVPWRSSYRTTQLFKGDSRFALSSAGHIAGIVNPPGPKPKVWLNDATPSDPQMWLDGATRHDDTWWHDWARWTHEHSGEWTSPPPIGGGYEPLGEAPGSYVFG